MSVFEHDHEQVVYLHDVETKLHAIVAIHSTALGPALGGTRMLPYASEDEALADVLNLAKAMSFKSAAAGLDLGGGKAVILADASADRERLMTAYGGMLDRLKGVYITTEDVGTTEADMVLIGAQTRHVTGLPISSGGSGDPSDATAWGLLAALRAVAGRRWGGELRGKHVAISGVGKVGKYFCGYLARAGCRMTIADISDEATRRVAASLDVDVVSPDDVHKVRCDVFAPCALGGVLNDVTIPELACSVLLGSANNQLADRSCADKIDARGILYVPDYIANAGGVINIAEELGGYDRRRAFERVAGIEQTVLRVLDAAKSKGITPAAASDEMASERIGRVHSRRCRSAPL